MHFYRKPNVFNILERDYEIFHCFLNLKLLSFQGDGWTTPGGDLNSSSGSTGPVSIEGRSETPELPVALDPIEVEKAIEQRSYRLQELLESERVYINDLVN